MTVYKEGESGVELYMDINIATIQMRGTILTCTTRQREADGSPCQPQLFGTALIMTVMCALLPVADKTCSYSVENDGSVSAVKKKRRFSCRGVNRDVCSIQAVFALIADEKLTQSRGGLRENEIAL